MEEKSQLRQMEELDAKVEKINYDLLGLESRKNEMENKKIEKQKEIEVLQEEKNEILAKTDNMNRLQKIIYIIVASRTDLKRVELINAKITESQKAKDSIQNKIDIQNGLYAETIKEKEQYIEKRRELYVSKTIQKENVPNEDKLSDIKGLIQIFELTKQFKNNKIMCDLNQLVEKEINQYLETNSIKKVNAQQNEEQDEMV